MGQHKRSISSHILVTDWKILSFQMNSQEMDYAAGVFLEVFFFSFFFYVLILYNSNLEEVRVTVLKSVRMISGKVEV